MSKFNVRGFFISCTVEMTLTDKYSFYSLASYLVLIVIKTIICLSKGKVPGKMC